MTGTRSGEGPVLVIGAGIIGLAIALRLAHGGRSVAVIDRQSPGRGCSYGNVGRIASECVEPLASPRTLMNAPRYLLSRTGPLSIAPRYAHRILPWLMRFALASTPSRYARGVAALRALQQDSLPAFTRLLDDAGLEPLLKTRGHVVVSEAADARAALLERQSELERHGVKSRIMSRGDVRQLAPELGENVSGGLYFPDTAHVVDPFRVCRGLAKAIEQRGGRILRGDVQSIRVTADGRFDVTASGQKHPAATLVVAAGAWSRPLARQLGHRLPLDTERGYHLTATGWRTDLRLPVESMERHTVMTPMRDGLRITGFVEFGGLELPPDARRYETLRAHLHALLPGAELSTVTEWMGCRPSLPDHLPVIGRCRGHERAILAFGHQHLGLTLSGITAELVEALVDGRTPAIDLQPFRCERFD